MNETKGIYVYIMYRLTELHLIFLQIMEANDQFYNRVSYSLHTMLRAHSCKRKSVHLMRQACQHLCGTHCEDVMLHTVLNYKTGEKEEERGGRGEGGGEGEREEEEKKKKKGSENKIKKKRKRKKRERGKKWKVQTV